MLKHTKKEWRKLQKK